MADAPQKPYSLELLQLLDQCCTPYHTVAVVCNQLQKQGFIQLREEDEWCLEEDCGYFVSRGDTSVIAFHTGTAPWNPIQGFRIGLCHTDAPSLKLRLRSAEQRLEQLRIPVEVYGGPILSSWLDRPLDVAGQLFGIDANGETVSLLVRSESPLAVIPNPAIHLVDLNHGFAYNPQQHLAALLGRGNLHDLWEQLIPQEFRSNFNQIMGGALYLVDGTPATLCGLNGDYIQAGRLDNAISCLAFCQAMARAVQQPQYTCQVAAFFDLEETGSNFNSAGSSFLPTVLKRITNAFSLDSDAFYRKCANSFMVSADAAHAIHPNFPEYHENAEAATGAPGYALNDDCAYSPKPGKGVVLKSQCSQSYATTAVGETLFNGLCSAYNIPCQYFLPRSDKRFGRTIGPNCAAELGIPTVDIGAPMWSMHSCRETMCLDDVAALVDFMGAFWCHPGLR